MAKHLTREEYRIYSVVEFGARPNVTGKADVFIKAAIDAAAADGGGIVYIPPGSFNVDYIELQSNVTVRGSGKGTILKPYGDYTGHWLVTTVDSEVTEYTLNSGIEDLVIDGENKASHGIALSDIKHTTIRNVEVRNTRNHGIFFDSLTTGLSIENVLVSGATGNGIHFTANPSKEYDSEGVSMKNVTIEYCGMGLCSEVGLTATISDLSVWNCRDSGIVLSHTIAVQNGTKVTSVILNNPVVSGNNSDTTIQSIPKSCEFYAGNINDGSNPNSMNVVINGGRIETRSQQTDATHGSMGIFTPGGDKIKILINNTSFDLFDTPLGGRTYWAAYVQDTNKNCVVAEYGNLTAFNGTVLQVPKTSHSLDTTIHITAAERTKWNDVDKKSPYIVIDKASGGSYPDPDTFLDASFITNHANAQSPGSGNSQSDFWYIEQIFYSAGGSSNSRSQLARTYLGTKADIKVRHFYNGTWSPWSPSLQSILQGGGSVQYGYYVAEPSSLSGGASRSLTIPEGVKTIYVTAIGGGGGGGGGGGVAPSNYAGGGGTGAIAYRVPAAVTPGSTITVIVGGGGAGGTTNGSGAQGTSGSSGGTTSIVSGSTTLVAAGGGNGGFGLTSGGQTSGGLGGTAAIRNGTNLATRPSMNGRSSDDSVRPMAYGTFYRGFQGRFGDASMGLGANLTSIDLTASNNGTILAFLSSFYSTVFGNNIHLMGGGGNGVAYGTPTGTPGYSGIAFIEWGL